ncbi:MAG: FAD-binding protein [Thermoplasmata archaeon]
MESAGIGRAIYPGGAPSDPVPASFSAKEEPLEGVFATELSRLGLRDLRLIASCGERMLYSRDQSEIPRPIKEMLFNTIPELVVQPRSTEAVSAVLRHASAWQMPIVPRGSASSPFGGSIPVKGGLVVDMSRMDRILSLDREKMAVTVQAGARWADVDHYLERFGLSLITCPSSKFSTVAGWIATGGMGLNSYSSGHLSKSVISIEIVSPDGSVRVLTPADTAFPAVFGSEGQLGVITSATLSVRRKPTFSRPHLVFFDDLRSALGFANALTNSSVRPAHIMYESAAKFSLINRALGSDRFRAADAIIVNIEDKESEDALKAFLRNTGLSEEKEYLARYMWNERYFPMKIRKFGPGMLGTEVLMPVPCLADGISQTTKLSAEVGVEPLFEAHFLQGGWSLLLCYFVTDQGNTVAYTLDAFKSLLFARMLMDAGGKPYSIGIWNHPFSIVEDVERVERLKMAKAEMDPKELMNSGKYFALSGRLGGILSAGFSPGFVMPALKTFVLFSPITARILRIGHGFADRRLRPKSRPDLLRIADECAMCGACVGVCPAYLVVGDERVTARGKLLTVKAMARGIRPSREHAHRIFLCMKCKACEQVCQSKLELMPAFESLEKELEQMYGRDAEEIERFVNYVESLPEFDALVERGLVIGAPRHGMGGGSADV